MLYITINYVYFLKVLIKILYYYKKIYEFLKNIFIIKFTFQGLLILFSPFSKSDHRHFCLGQRRALPLLIVVILFYLYFSQFVSSSDCTIR